MKKVYATHFGLMFSIPLASGSLDCETKCEAGNRKLSSKSGTKVSVWGDLSTPNEREGGRRE